MKLCGRQLPFSIWAHWLIFVKVGEQQSHRQIESWITAESCKHWKSVRDIKTTAKQEKTVRSKSSKTVLKVLTLQPIRLELNTCTQVFPFFASCTSSSLLHWTNAQVTFHIECCEYQVLMQVNLCLLFIWFSFFSHLCRRMKVNGV